MSVYRHIVINPPSVLSGKWRANCPGGYESDGVRSESACVGCGVSDGSSQEALAGLAGLRHACVGSVERSSRKIWPDSIRALADALEVTAADLLTLARASCSSHEARGQRAEAGRD